MNMAIQPPKRPSFFRLVVCFFVGYGVGALIAVIITAVTG